MPVEHQLRQLMMLVLCNLAVVIALAASTLAVAAAPDTPNAAVRAACAADARRFCNEVVADLASRRWCMFQHHAQLSPGCRAAIAQRKAAGFADAAGDYCQNRCLRFCAMKQPAPGLYRGECNTVCQRNCYRTSAERHSRSSP